MDITNLDTYNARMASSIEDKMWFWNKVKHTTDCVVDYGCADASLLSRINEEHPYQTLIGYDASDDMLARAKEKLKTHLFALQKVYLSQKCQGRISNWANCIHYLLKAPYDENWAREVEENYVPFTMNEVLAQYNVDSPVKYDVVYFEAYTLPYVRERIIRDYNISLYAPTHYKLLLERRF